MTEAIPAEIEKGRKQFEKLNKRIIFTVDKSEKELLAALSTKTGVKKTVKVKSTDYSKFVGKNYSKKGGTNIITVVSYNDGEFTIKGNNGEVKRSTTEFMKDLKSLQEVKLPEPTPEVNQEFVDRIKLSKEDLKETREKSKNVTDEELDNLNFDC